MEIGTNMLDLSMCVCVVSINTAQSLTRNWLNKTDLFYSLVLLIPGGRQEDRQLCC